MSCWIVHERHIDFLVASFTASDELCPDIARDRTQLGAYLWRINHGSYAAFTGQPAEPPAYTYQPLSLPDLTTWAGINYSLNAVLSYRCQSNHHPDWYSSDADRWTGALEAAYEKTFHAVAGYSQFSMEAEKRSQAGWRVLGDYDPGAASVEDLALTIYPTVTLSDPARPEEDSGLEGLPATYGRPADDGS